MSQILTLEDIKFQHLIRKIPSSRKAIPVLGYYNIISKLPSNFTGTESYLNGYLFKAYYHPTLPDFSLKFAAPMLIWAFYNNCSVGPKEFTLDELINTVVHIKEVALIPDVDIETLQEKDSKSYAIHWDVIDYRTTDSIVIKDSVISDDNGSKDPEEDSCLFSPDEELELLAEEEATELFDEELAEILFDADIESIDWELEEIFRELNESIDDEDALVFWETNQPLDTGEIDW